MGKDNNIAIYKGGIISKIKNFIKNIFNKFKYENNYKEEKNIYNQESNFKKEIEIKENEEKLRILKLQQDYKNGLITEEEISKEDYSKLLDLYDEQNKIILEEIEREKIEIKNMLQKFKNNK